MQYLSAKEIAEKWGVSPILVKRLCRQGRVPGAVQKKDGWSIPEDAVREERTVLEYTEEPELPELAKKLRNQKKKRNFHGLYDFVVIDLTYSSSRMASCRLTRQQVRPGEYRTVTSRPRDRELLPVSQINSSLTALIRDYEHQTEIERNQILDFHVRFEEIFPFEDGNGRVGRLIMFKECLRHGIMPFIIDDKRRSRYLRGIKEWHDDRFEMIDVVMEAQDRFEAQIELQRLHAAGQFFTPATYQEGFDDEDECVYNCPPNPSGQPAAKPSRQCPEHPGSAVRCL